MSFDSALNQMASTRALPTFFSKFISTFMDQQHVVHVIYKTFRSKPITLPIIFCLVLSFLSTRMVLTMATLVIYSFSLHRTESCYSAAPSIFILFKTICRTRGTPADICGQHYVKFLDRPI